MRGEVLFDDISRTLFSTAACMYQVKPLGVVVPRTIEDVVTTVRYCSANGIPITSRGAGTGLAGQSIGNGIILLFNKFFRGVSAVDRENLSATVEPGVTLDDLNRRLKPDGLMFGPDPSSGKQCVIGGMIGTNAAGPHTLKYGATKDNLLDLSVVTADGELLTLSDASTAGGLGKRISDILSPHRGIVDAGFPRTSKNSSGYNLRDALAGNGIDLVRLLCGSEGTLGITVGARLSLTRVPLERSTLIAYFHSYEDCANAAIESLQFGPAAVEMLDKTFAAAALGIDPDMDAILNEEFTSILIFEFEESEPGLANENMTALSAHIERLGLPTRQILPRDEKEAAKLWRLRKQASSIFYKIEKPGKKVSVVEDVAVPVGKLPVYLSDVRKIFRNYGLQCALYGHAGNGNTHAIVLLDMKNREHLRKIDPLAQEVYDLAISLGGTMSGEHGDGFLRTPFLSRLYGEKIYSLFREIKDVFDPQHILNPGKIIGDQGSSIVHDLRYGEGYTRIATGTTLDDERIAHEIEKCHGCGVCLSYCPTSIVTHDERATPRAKGNILRALIGGNLGNEYLATREFKEVLDYCFNCKLCLTECPTSIDIPGIVVEAKTIFISKTERTKQDRFINRLPFLSAAASVSPTLSSVASNLQVVRKPLERLFGIDRRRRLPIFHKPLFKRIGINRKNEKAQKKVIYFSGCFANYNDVSGEGIATIEVLRRNNVDVRVLDSLRCCGIAKITTGNRDETAEDARWNVEELSRYVDAGFDVVVSAPSCGLAIKEDYPLMMSNEESRKVSDHVFELSDYLIRLHREGKLNTNFGTVKKRLTYHNPCHSIPMGVVRQPVELMRMIPGLEVVELAEDSCCGMAGTFGLKRQFYDLSMQVGSGLFGQIEAAHADAVVTTCGTCNIQIAQGSGSRVVHLAKVLLESYDGYRSTGSGAERVADSGVAPLRTLGGPDKVIE